MNHEDRIQLTGRSLAEAFADLVDDSEGVASLRYRAPLEDGRFVTIIVAIGNTVPEADDVAAAAAQRVDPSMFTTRH